MLILVGFMFRCCSCVVIVVVVKLSGMFLVM